MEDYKGTLDYYQQALRASEKVLGKTHPDTLDNIMNTANMHTDMRDSQKAAEMYKLVLDDYMKTPKLLLNLVPPFHAPSRLCGG